MHTPTPHKGFTLVEILIAVAILTLISYSVSTFQRDLFSLNHFFQSSLNTQLDARHILKVMVAELREASPSSLGSYPVELASSTALTFYSDINNDGLKERVRYYVQGNRVMKGVVSPSGNPLIYNGASETVTTLITGYVASSTLPMFQYFPSTYAGTSTALSYPIDTSRIRLIKISVIIDRDANKSPIPIVVTSQVTIRNLKDNL